jgi:sugar lactone lactonase YvrE
MTQIECVLRSEDQIGEAPVWCDRTNLLWWVDVRGPKLQSFDPATGRHEVYWTGGRALGGLALRESGGMILAQDDGIHAFTPGDGERRTLLHPEEDRPDNRLNDGRCDRRGRLWIGSMNDTVRRDDGNFWRIGTDRSARKLFDGIDVPNGVCFSPDDKIMYFADTPKRMIWAFDFDLDAGAISNRRVFADLTANPGRPDGSTVDAEGFVWNCEFAGRRIVRYAPDGSVDRIVEMPVTNVTCAGFAGPNRDVLYATTARQGLSEAQRAAEPDAGGLFRLDVGVKGLPEPRYGG